MKMGKEIFSFLKVVIIDILVMVIYLFYTEPDESVSIILIFIIPFLFIVNMIIAGIMFLVKRNFWGTLFVLNSLISIPIMVILFHWATILNYNWSTDVWQVSIKGKEYRITNDRKINYFFVEENIGKGQPDKMENYGRSVRYGDYNLFYSTKDSLHFFIHNDFIFNFKGIRKEQTMKIE